MKCDFIYLRSQFITGIFLCTLVFYLCESCSTTSISLFRFSKKYLKRHLNSQKQTDQINFSFCFLYSLGVKNSPTQHELFFSYCFHVMCFYCCLIVLSLFCIIAKLVCLSIPCCFSITWIVFFFSD